MRALGLLAALGAGTALLAGALASPPAPALGPLARADIALTGVSNPVTAVLLDYRSYDTLLELAVVLLAVVGAQALAPVRPAPQPLQGPVAAAAARLLAPAIVMLGGFVLWIGATAPGGAFQAAALLAGGLILLETVGRGVRLGPPALEPARLNAAAAVGVALFVLAGAVAGLVSGAALDWPAAQAGAIILGVEIAATAGLAVGLLALFRAGTAA